MSVALNQEDRSVIKTASALSVVAYEKTNESIQLPAGNWQLLEDSGLAFINDQNSGYQARIYVNHDTKQIFFANAGTNDLKDVAGWPSAYLGLQSNQFKDALTAGAAVDNLVKRDPAYSGYTIITTGHSWGELLAQTQAYTFGWQGIGFDGPGAALVVQSSAYQQLANNLGIAPVGQTDFISCNTQGFSLLGGGVVGSFGANIGGTRECTVALPGSTSSVVFNVLTTALSSNPLVGFGLGKLLGGVLLHSMEGINQAVQQDRFYVEESTTSNANHFSAFNYQDAAGNRVTTLQDSQGNVLLDNYGFPRVQVSLKDGSTTRTQQFDSSGKVINDQLKIADTNYNLADQYQRLNAEYQLKKLLDAGTISSSSWQNYTSSTSQYLLSATSGVQQGFVLRNINKNPYKIKSYA